MKYAANNSYGNETSTGFANTWYVLAFDSAAHRDAYIDASKSLAARPISRSQIRQYVEAPKPFSGARRAIGIAARDDIPGLVGEVCVCYPGDANYVRDL